MRIALKSFLIILLAMVAASAAQEAISVDSEVDRSSILIGDVFRYTVTITHAPEVQIQTPTLAANLGAFEIRDYTVHDPVEVDGQIVEKTDYMLSTFETGEYEIPPLEIGYTSAKDPTLRIIKTPPITIMVESLNPDEAGDIRDIKPPLVPPRDLRRLLLMAAVILLAILLAGFIFYYLKRRREGKGLLPTRQAPPRPAHEVALEALQRLVESDLLAEGKIKLYYSELSEIIRAYIENRFEIPALEMTTYQLLDNLTRRRFDSELIEMMREFLELCDLVKFAKYGPSQEEHDRATRIAFDFVEMTRPVEETEAAESEATETAEPVAEEEVHPTESPETERES